MEEVRKEGLQKYKLLCCAYTTLSTIIGKKGYTKIAKKQNIDVFI